jgi:hypothetical protein
MQKLMLAALLGVLVVAVPSQAQSYRGYFPPRRYEPPPPTVRQDEADRLVRYWYDSYLRRPAYGQAVRVMAESLRRRQPPLEVLAALLGGVEYYDYSGGTPAGFINQLILDVGHHHPTGQELSDHLRRLRHESRREVARWFLREYPQNWVPGLPGSPPPDYGYDRE